MKRCMYTRYENGMVYASGTCSQSYIMETADRVKKYGLESFRWLYTISNTDGTYDYKYECTRDTYNVLERMDMTVDEIFGKVEEPKLGLLQKIMKLFKSIKGSTCQ